MVRLMLFWDYDTQWGADRSRVSGGPKNWGHLEFENTEKLLELHAKFNIPACFAIVGAAALQGKRPYHDPAQIRRIFQAGHEIASHSFKHEWLPGLNSEKLLQTLKESKDALEQCIGEKIISFVPPFNQPFDFPQKLAISLSERREAKKNRIDVKQLCHALHDTGYQFVRLKYINIIDQVFKRNNYVPEKLKTVENIYTIRLNTPGGFSNTVINSIIKNLNTGGIWVIYGHPHSISNPQSFQSIEKLIIFFEKIKELKNHFLGIKFSTPSMLLKDYELETGNN